VECEARAYCRFADLTPAAQDRLRPGLCAALEYALLPWVGL